uniref:Putative major capsid protein n=1 Tax=viral metagenome TaxID=1070528 RepID=A0A6H1ZSV1_9ZZZZ
MALTEFGTNSSQTVKIWSSRLLREALKSTLFSKFLGKAGEKKAILMRLVDLEKGAGDQIKFDLLMQATGGGVTGDNVLKDNEEALVYYQDTITIDQLRHGHSFRRMSQQRTLHDLRSDARENLSDWWAGKFDSYMFDFLCGNTSRTHGETALAPDSDHYILSGDVTNSGTIATDEASLGDNDQIQLADLDYCKEKAKTLTPPVRPVIVDGKEVYVVVLHSYSITDLRLDVAGSTYTSWPEIQLNAAQIGKDNPLMTGAMGMYNGMVLYESSRVYNPTGSVRRNLFLGAQAGAFALGNAYDRLDQRKYGKENLMSWFERIDDYGNEKGVAAGAIFGMVGTRFNSKDYGKIVISSYAAAHA